MATSYVPPQVGPETGARTGTTGPCPEWRIIMTDKPTRLRRRLAIAAGLAIAALVTNVAIAQPASAASTVVRQTVTRGCQWTSGTGTFWAAKADVTVAHLSGSSFHWIESATNPRTALTGYTFAWTETNAHASAVI